MQNRMIPVLTPDYYDKFSCIGGACEDNCCNGWEIVIDKNTYDRYRNIKAPSFKASFPSRVKRMKGEKADNARYAVLIRDEADRCKFLREDGLCEIHADYGEKYLSNICKIYPRRCCVMQDNLFELSLIPSCPEALRKMIFDPEPMAVSIKEMPQERIAAFRYVAETSFKDHKSAHLAE